MSFVVCSFNGFDRIGGCLDSLDKQSYPRESYEIILVDDGSTDGTAELAAQFGARVIRHTDNRGIPQSRNAGLSAAQGEIVAYVDDDVLVSSSWLTHVLRPFQDVAVVAAGGRVTAAAANHLAERYLGSVGYANPAPLDFGRSKNPLFRFWYYVKDMYHPIALSTEPLEVQAVYTTNAAYRKSALNQVNGFDEDLLSAEDTDISTRLRRDGGRIVFEPSATVLHYHDKSLSALLKKTYLRSENTLKYYLKESIVPPIYPFPFIYVVILIGTATIASVPAAMLPALLAPYVLYSWWIRSAIRTHRREHLIYPYIQLAVESATILGLLRGVLRIAWARQSGRPSAHRCP